MRRLALTLGYVSVGKMLADMGSSSELTEWLAYDRIEPFGPRRDDLRAGTVAMAALSPWCRDDPPRPLDFFPNDQVPLTAGGMEEMKAHRQRELEAKFNALFGE